MGARTLAAGACRASASKLSDPAWLVLLPLGLLRAWCPLEFSSACVQTGGCYLSTGPPSRLPTPSKYYPAPALQAAHPRLPGHRVLGSTRCHPAALPVPPPVFGGLPPLAEGKICPSAAAVLVLRFTGTLCHCIVGVRGTSVLHYLAPVAALWCRPSWGTGRGTSSHVPCRQGCAGCHALRFAVDGVMKELLFGPRCWYVSKLAGASGVLGYVFWRRCGVCCPRTCVRDGGGCREVLD